MKLNTLWKTLSPNSRSKTQSTSPEDSRTAAIPKEHGPAGYLINRPGGPTGEPGPGFDYLLARNGVYIQDGTACLTARVLVAPAHVRGLEPASPQLELPQGRIPKALFETGLRWFQDDSLTERFFAVRWDGEFYRLDAPNQTGTRTGVRYQPRPGMVAEFHSHCNMRAFFSHTDDLDEQGLRIYGVVGKLDTPWPELKLRTGVYGHFAHADWQDVFEGPTPGVLVETEDGRWTQSQE